MSILNVNKIQPVGSGQTVTISAANISAPTTTITAGTFSATSGSTFPTGPVLIGSATSTGTASQRLQVTGRGYFSQFVGIGTTTNSISVSELLEVNGGYAAFVNSSVNVAPIYAYNYDTTASTNQPYITLADNSGNRGTIGVNYTDTALWIHGQNGIRFRYGGTAPGTTEAARFDSSGNLGIGTNSLQSSIKLDVRGALHVGGGTEGIRLGNLGDNTAYDNVKLYYTGYNSANPYVYLTPRTVPGSGNINTYLYLQSAGSSGSSNTMGLLVDGSVGIGTISPVKKLHVQTSLVSGSARGGTYTQTLFESNNASTSYWEFQANASSTSDILFSKSSTGTYGIVGYDHSAEALRFHANSGERLRIDSGGRLLVGVTTTQYAGTLLHANGNTVFKHASTGANRQYSNTIQGATGHSPTVSTFVKYITTTSLGTQLRIPILYQANLNTHTYLIIRGSSGLYNTRDPLPFSAEIAIGHLTVLSNQTNVSTTGNIASITTTTGSSSSAPHYINLNFTTAYTGATAQGVNIWLEFLSLIPDYSIDVDGIYLN